MKKIILLGSFALFGATNAQEGFNVGAHVGLPMGDAKDAYSFKLGLDASYMFPVADNFKAGIASGYQAWLGKSYSLTDGSTTISGKYDTISMVPIAATGMFKVNDQFGIGADLGYGFMFASGESEGGFYYQPKVSYSFGDSGALWLGYQGLSKNGFTFSAINLGYSFNIAK